MTQERLLERTHYCAEVAGLSAGKTACVAGWVRKRRDLGNLVFVDLYDRTGLLQVVFDPDRNPSLLKQAGDLKRETVLTVKGVVSLRPDDAVNPKMITGKVELVADSLTVHSTSKVPPFHLIGDQDVSEELRLQYRYLDLRRPQMYRIIQIRHEVSHYVRNFYHDNGFMEVTTPHLIRSTPEGARDFLVPSRLHKGMSYALPQSPQMLKQILMIAGTDRYFQIVKCFRDEDSRADRQPEFSQIDVEMSFTGMETLFSTHESLMSELFSKLMERPVQTPFKRMTYAEAMLKYGSDKPDLRFDLEISDVSELVSGHGFGIVDKTVESGGVVRALAYPGGASISRKQIGEIEEVAKRKGAGGMIAIKLKEGLEMSGSPLARSMPDSVKQSLVTQLNAEPGDLLCMVAGAETMAANAMGDVRLEIGKRESLKRDELCFLWVTEFPLFEYSEENKRYNSMHHPFTAPMEEDVQYLQSDPGKCRSKAYDLVLNGCELGGGSVRIHNAEVQSQMFSALGIGLEEAESQFGFFLEALKYGTPPHCGIAFGLDRMVMLLAGTENLQDVIPFPKTMQGFCRLTLAPSPVTKEQLEIVGLKKIELDSRE